MRRAIELAVENVRSARGGPFGCVIARGDAILAEGVNQVTSANDPTAHAEIVAIRRACEMLGRFELRGCLIYTSCEPCPMCLGAVYWARLDRLYFGATREDAARAGFDDSFIYDQIAVAPAERRVPAIALLRDEAAGVFDEWRRAPNRIPY
jgi:guanine deaminase